MNEILIVTSKLGDMCMFRSNEVKKGDRIYANLPKPQPAQPISRDLIKEIFMNHGFVIKDGQTDLKEYVYSAASELIHAALATPQPAEPVALKREPLCRDCADFGPICPIDGKPCDPDAPPPAQPAQPAQPAEPVAEFRGATANGDYLIKPLGSLTRGMLLYTTPQPQRQPLTPLTDEQFAELETMSAQLREQNTAVDAACAKLEAANAELVEALKELKMWLPIAVELAGLDPETTEVEFEFEDGSPPKKISLKSSMNLARVAIAKHGTAA